MRRWSISRLVSIKRKYSNRWPYLVVLGLYLAAGIGGVVLTLVMMRPTGRIDTDSAIFAYIGQQMTEGAVVYIDIWDVKPPLTHLTSALLASLAPTPWSLHYLGVIVSIAALAGIGLLITWVCREIVEFDDVSSILAGTSLLTFFVIYFSAARGYRPKYLALLSVLIAIVFLYHDAGHPFAVGIFATASVGYWQLNIIVPVVCLLFAYQRYGIRGAGSVLLGGTGIVVLMLAPFALIGDAAFKAMFVETVLAPSIIDEGGTLASRAITFLAISGYSALIVAISVVGLVILARRSDWSSIWPLLILAAWYGLQIIFLDLDAADDLMHFMAFAALGLGAAVNQIRERFDNRMVVVATLGILLLMTLQPLWVTGIGTPLPGEVEVSNHRQTQLNEIPPAPDNSPDVRDVFIKNSKSGLCHIRLSRTERQWIRMTSHTWVESKCGWISATDLERYLGIKSGFFDRQ